MDSLGLVEVLGQMLRDSKPFASYLAGQLRAHPNVALLLDLADMGLGSHTPVSFLTREQQARLREVTSTMPSEEARAFLDALKTPDVDNMSLIDEFQIPPRDRGVLGTLAREVLLEIPYLVRNPDMWTRVVREKLQAARR